MIIFFAEGRLGNQIFQYMFLKTIRNNNEKIVVNGFDNLQEVFENNDYINLPNKNKILRKIWQGLLKPTFLFLSKSRLISTVRVNTETLNTGYIRETQGYTTISGILKGVRFVELGFFQSEFFFKQSFVKTLVIKKDLLEKATYILKNIDIEQNKICVHIRRTDHASFDIYGKKPLLPTSYFETQFNYLLKQKPDSFFIFLSDDIEFVKKNFSHIQNSIIASGNHYGVDFAIMTLCNDSILSPSTFGWWGSYLMKKRGIVIAPLYWLGFKSKKDYPSAPLAHFMKPIEIINERNTI